MARHFGIVTTRAAKGAQPPRGPHFSARNTGADSNVISFPPSAARDLRIPDDVKNFAALWFAMAALASPFALFGCAATIFLLFF